LSNDANRDNDAFGARRLQDFPYFRRLYKVPDSSRQNMQSQVFNFVFA
jgi:hypothetical protein